MWASVGMFASIVALTITYYLLGPSAFTLRYADVLGWSTIVVFLLLMIQGFWSRRGRKSGGFGSKRMPTVSYQATLSEWGGIHTTLSLVVTFFLIVHGFLFLPGLSEPSLVLWLGALAFLVLLVLNFSGLATEAARKSRTFGLLKKWHVWLMLLVLILIVVHVGGEATSLSMRSALPGMLIGLAAGLFVWIVAPLTAQLIHHI